MQVFVNFLIYLFSSKKTLIYSTFSVEEYFRVVNLLKNGSVSYRTASFSQSSEHSTHSDLGNEYKIYVKKSDQHLAQRALAKQ